VRLGFIGYGTLGRFIEKMMVEDAWDRPVATVYFDDNASANHLPNAVPFDTWREDGYADISFVVALGYKQLSIKHRLVEEMKRGNRKLLSVIHSSVTLSPSAAIGDGVVIYSGCVVDQNVEIGDGAIVANSTTTAHDTRIGRASFVGPGVTIAGNVTVGDRVFIGCGSSVANSVRIGEDCVVGIGSVVTRDLAAGCSAIGSPLRVLAKRLNLR
jgi:sugar O-acyltransferase (sialic acid O-acetyltransferase NeuD family)